jgi:hypothetical protein
MYESLSNHRYFSLLVIGAFLLSVIGSSLFFGTSGLKESLENYIFVKPARENYPEFYNGLPEPTSSLHMLSENVVKSECCTDKNDYTSSNGCVCVSKEQMDYLNKRGGNAL